MDVAAAAAAAAAAGVVQLLPVCQFLVAQGWHAAASWCGCVVAVRSGWLTTAGEQVEHFAVQSHHDDSLLLMVLQQHCC